MDRYEVTKAQWDEVAEWAASNGYDISAAGGSGKGPDHPVHYVTWYECVKWCNARTEYENETQGANRSVAYYTSSAKTAVYRTGRVGHRRRLGGLESWLPACRRARNGNTRPVAGR